MVSKFARELLSSGEKETKKKKPFSKLRKKSKNIEVEDEKVRGLSPKTKIINNSPLILIKRDGPDILNDTKFKNWLASVPGFIEGLTKVNDRPTRLYDYQIAHMNNRNKFRIANKSRQIGWSFGISCEALAKCHLCDINSSIIISYNREEAGEKIMAAQALYESMPLEYQKKRIVDNKQSQVFKNQKGQITRIISTAQRPPRGKGYNTDVYFDEYAFWQWPDKIFTASVPVITRGTGTLTIGSTPLGARGKFFEILTDKNTYPLFSRQLVPWWHCPDLCTNMKKAFYEADKMSTVERVEKFATGTLKVLFESMSIDEFQQEFELAFIDENVSYFPIDIVNQCVFIDESDEFQFDEIKNSKKDSIVIDKQQKGHLAQKYPKLKFFCCDNIEDFNYKMKMGEISNNLVAGFDVGRKKDKSELIVLEEIDLNDRDSIMIMRFYKQFDREKFQYQENFLKELLENFPIKKLAIDSGGLGMNLAENLHEKYRGRVEMIELQLDWKARAAQVLRIRFEQLLLAIPDHEDLKRQIGSIKKKVSDSGMIRFDADKNKDHHGDKFWSLALAAMMSHIDVTSRIPLADLQGNKENERFLTKIISPYKEVINEEIVVSRNPLVYVPNESILSSSFVDVPSPIHSLLYPGVNLEQGLERIDNRWSNEFLTHRKKN